MLARIVAATFPSPLLVLLLLAFSSPANAVLTQLSNPSQLTAAFTLVNFSTGSAGLVWGPPGQAVATDSIASYGGPLPSPPRFLQCDGPLTLTFPDPTTQVGLWFGHDNPGIYPAFDVTVEAFGTGGSLGSITTAANMNYAVDQFIGLISTEAVTSVEVSYSLPSYLIVVDDVYFADPIRPTPPPDPDPNDAFAVNFLSETRSVVGSSNECNLNTGECTSQDQTAVPSAPFADFVASTIAGGSQNSGFTATGFYGSGWGYFDTLVGAGFSQTLMSTSDFTVEFEVTTVSTISIDATAPIVAWVEFSEESYVLFEIPGTGSATHEDTLYPGLTYTFTAASESFFWDFTVEIEEQAVAVPALDTAGRALLLAALVAAAMGAAGMGLRGTREKGRGRKAHEAGAGSA